MKIKFLSIKFLSIAVFLILQPLSLFGQEQTVSIKAEYMTLKEVFNLIEQQTGLSVAYIESVINPNDTITVNIAGKTVKEALDILLKNSGINYEIRDGKILLSLSDKKAEKILKIIKVKGVVSNESGETIVGANVRVKGSNEGAVSDVNGRYEVDVESSALLVFSFVGMKTEEVKVAGRSVVNIQMNAANTGLEEVVVVGYGVQKRSDLSGAIASVSFDKLNAIPSNSISEMLRGQATGVQILTTSAAPGGSSSVLIRGRQSLSGGNEPLYIVDGVPMSGIDDINASDIASLEVLKDASSQSIYGARAANGVILITTKRGQTGKPTVTYNGYVARQDYTRNFNFYTGEQWADMRKEAYYNANGFYDEIDCFRGVMLDVLSSGEFVDWEELMLKPAWQTKHDIMVQSGNDKIKYALSVGYFGQDGIVSPANFKRLSGRLNLDYKLLNNFTIGTNFYYARSWTQSVDGSFNSFITMPPLAKIYNEDGSLREDVTDAGETHTNPLWNINNAKNSSTSDRLLLNLFAEWQIIEGLTYRANLSMNNKINHANQYLGLKHTTGRNNYGRSTVGVSFTNDYLLENIVNYIKDFNKSHHFEATLVQSINAITYKNISITGSGFPNDDLLYNAIGNANEFGTPVYQLSNRKLLSFMGRLRYNLFGRYLFTAAVRVDGASVFGKNNKYGVFPSAAFAWRISEESFLENVNWVSNLKLRLSYGSVGNQAVNPYKSLGLATMYMYEFGDERAIGYLPGNELTNPELKWETSTSYNAGLDFSFLNNRINGAVDFYMTNTTDLLATRTLTATLGYGYQTVNLAQVSNKGVEVMLNFVPVRNKEVVWDITMTFSHNKNTIIKVDDRVDEDGKPIDDINNSWFISYPVNVYYDYVFDGIWQLGDDIANSHMPDAKPGGIKLKDIDADGEITEKDRVVYQRDPLWFGSLSSKITYFGFDLTVDFYASYGGIISNPYLTSFNQGGDLTGKRSGIFRNYWTTNNPSNEAPAPNLVQQPAYITTLGYQNATYFRLRNVRLGYSFPKSLINKAKMQQLRLYVSLTNYLTFTKVLSYGPEQTSGAYPEPKTMLLGLNVTF